MTFVRDGSNKLHGSYYGDMYVGGISVLTDDAQFEAETGLSTPEVSRDDMVALRPEGEIARLRARAAELQRELGERGIEGFAQTD